MQEIVPNKQAPFHFFKIQISIFKVEGQGIKQIKYPLCVFYFLSKFKPRILKFLVLNFRLRTVDYA